MIDLAIALSLESSEQKMEKDQSVHPSSQSALDSNDAKKEFKCPICVEPMSPPVRIWQCAEGHILCENCKNHPDVRNCPACRGAFAGRNLAMERMAELVFKMD
eukprot:GFUD01125865.1.p1 GENE.GFUD01125865.1~~GFUD01125865.1.p1  ORF type:complete len:103 (+),score=24.42 GFUD01125865.1:3-311(+)